MSSNEELPQRQRAYIATVAAILRRGEADGVFRKGIDPVQLRITTPAIAFYYLNNRHAGRVLFSFDFTSRKALAARLKFNIDTILRLVLKTPPSD